MHPGLGHNDPDGPGSFAPGYTFSCTPRLAHGDRGDPATWNGPHAGLPDRRVDAIRGCVAIERGPVVYCFSTFRQLDRAPRPRRPVASRAACSAAPVTT